jgi:hypothetical protein
LHDNAPAHRALATKKLAYQCLDHPSYSSGSGPVGPPPVPWTEKKQLKGCHFSSNLEVIAAMETWLDRQLSEFSFEWLAKVRAMGQEVY